MPYNIYRPIILILVAFTVKSFTEWIAILLGMPPLQAENLSYMFMIIAGFATYMVFQKRRRK